MKDTAGYIANKLNISKSTVSKAMRHCSGVDSDTRQRILEECRGINHQIHSECAIYAILPDVPHYFWKEVKNGIRDGEQETAPVKYNIYTKTSDEATVLLYLDEAEKLNARSIIIASYITPKIHRRLEKMTEGRFVILLSEYYELKNSFFVGGNAYEDGYLMGKKYLVRYADRKLVLFSISNNFNVGKRLEGFCRAVEEECPQLIKDAVCIQMERKIIREQKLLPSKLAFLLTDAARDGQDFCIYSPMGMMQLPLGLNKAKLTDRAVCLCHDCFTEYQCNVKNLQEGFAVTCNQDIFGQGLAAIKAATEYVRFHTYPPQKEIYVPSYICEENTRT